ncbi:MAG TPA: hypothetical protein VLF89_02400 [Candidatus Saccharimonadales bacterium]|nr:hypothetical protein [Candidatus Saccharimonadales bacterium]
MEREPIDITQHIKFQPTLYAQDAYVSNQDYERREIQNPYQRLLWDFVDIDRTDIERQIAEQKEILDRKKEDDPFGNQRKLFELRYLHTIREEIASELGLSIDEQRKIHGYDLAFDGWNMWRNKEKQDKLEKITSLIRFNWATSLRERYGVNSSTTNLYSVENQLRSELWMDEPLEDVYIRGAAVRENGGSVENLRDKIEVFVFKATQSLLLEKTNKILRKSIPVGTRIISLSPPSIRTTLYPDNYVDVMELKEDQQTKGKYVALTRYKGTFSHEQYAEILRNNKSYQFLEHNKSLTDDERIKDNAFVIFPEDNFPDNDTLCADYFGTDKNALKDSEFQRTVLVACRPAINEYIRAISHDPIDWQEVHTCYENIYKLGDETVKQLKRHTEKSSYDFFVNTIESTLGRQEFLFTKQKQVLSDTELETVNAGCGETGSYIKKKKSPIEAYLSNVATNGILAELGIEDDTDEDGFLCPNCKKSWVKGNQCNGCGITQQKWAEKTGINCGGSSIKTSEKKQNFEEVFQPKVEKPRKLHVVKKQETPISIESIEFEDEAA